MRGAYEIRNRYREIRADLSAERRDVQYERLNKSLCEIDAALLEAEVLWGDRIKRARQLLKKCVSDYRLARRTVDRAQAKQRELNEEKHNKVSAILYDDCDETDNFAQQLERAVAEFERALLPYLGRRS